MRDDERYQVLLSELSLGGEARVGVWQEHVPALRAEFVAEFIEEGGLLRLRPERAWRLRGELLQPPEDSPAADIAVDVRKKYRAEAEDPYQAEAWLAPGCGWWIREWGEGPRFLFSVAAATAEECEARVRRALELVGQGAASRLPAPADWAGTEEHYVIHLAAPAVSVEKEKNDG